MNLIRMTKGRVAGGHKEDYSTQLTSNVKINFTCDCRLKKHALRDFTLSPPNPDVKCSHCKHEITKRQAYIFFRNP